MLPFMFLALPAGVLADVFDRRRYLIFVHLFLTLTAGLMAVATFAGIMRPALDGSDPEKFLEIFTIVSWEEHLRQHGGRLTASDRKVEERAQALADGPTEIQHLFPADTRTASLRRMDERIWQVVLGFAHAS